MVIKYMQTLEWFNKRIGQKVYRNDNGCPCHACRNVLENGLKIADEGHAEHLYDVQSEYMWDGIDLNYHDE